MLSNRIEKYRLRLYSLHKDEKKRYANRIDFLRDDQNLLKADSGETRGYLKWAAHRSGRIRFLFVNNAKVAISQIALQTLLNLYFSIWMIATSTPTNQGRFKCLVWWPFPINKILTWSSRIFHCCRQHISVCCCCYNFFFKCSLRWFFFLLKLCFCLNISFWHYLHERNSH